METLVEFLDIEPIENILGATIFKPKKLVYVCDHQTSKRQKEILQYYTKQKKLTQDVTFYLTDTTNLQAILSTLKKVTTENTNCVFDFTGGTDMVLLAAGIFCERYGTKAYYTVLPQGKFVNIAGCENLKEAFALPYFEVKDMLAATGASIEGYGHYRPDKKDSEMCGDVLKVWEIIRANTAAWGGAVAYLQHVTKAAGFAGRTPHQGLTITARKKIKVKAGLEVTCDVKIMQLLQAAGILTALDTDGEYVSFTYKNYQLAMCMTNHGIWLELYGFITAYKMQFFSHVKTSVIINWNAVAGGPLDTRNEVDILLVRGVTPIFISCKMGVPTPLALTEIKLIARRFGGAHAKAVLMTASNVRKDAVSVYQRAKEMDIAVVDANYMDKSKLEETLRQIAGGTFKN
ncbi:MAG: hypothetical protein PHG02_01620 [Oscillospiraceae bacterium]|nr:hypothetical protein [Oscillospiraceae bacterium]